MDRWGGDQITIQRIIVAIQKVNAANTLGTQLHTFYLALVLVFQLFMYLDPCLFTNKNSFNTYS